MKLFYILLITIALQSCGNQPKNEIQQNTENQNIIETTKNQATKKKNKTFKSVFMFEAYADDEGDYRTLSAKKDGKTHFFINERNEDRSLLRGDICEIEWEKDTIYIAGEGETPELADWVINIKKIKDGKVSQFRKKYTKKLKYHYSESYSPEFFDNFYLDVEYCVANSDNDLIKYAVANNETLEFSIEEQTKSDRTYIVLGIGKTQEHKFTVMQWIYFDQETKKIYEYDLPNDKLVEVE